MNITKQFLKTNQYVGKRSLLFPTNNIRQIVLHHTQGSTADGAIEWWSINTAQVATNYIIDKDGTVINTVPDNCWAWSLGISTKNNDIHEIFKNQRYARNIEQMGISIELVCEGELIKNDKGYLFEDGGRYIPESNVCILDKPHRGYKYYSKYTDAQILSLEKLLRVLSERHDINISGEHAIFDINYKALQGEKGLYSHVCYRSCDKTDIFPQPELITMLNRL